MPIRPATPAFAYTLAAALVVISLPLTAQLPPPPEETLADNYPGKSYSPYAGRGFPSRPYLGDSHLHTTL